ncbi:RNA-binding cell elongation regulator Jag/EloR [Dorea sp. AF36-15AT]|uniref:RNA-binding cell elongation regulator Jag/EloR n=1 Tax=Dorea sp. AF36-15AT TaxID=2292041 RepID=UPI000E511092|nr:RNA-binding cell elongation regulator Jag/EloR [Dorea sp. AF36-15AT]RHP07081.1 protein jag [Dorea sp. AF36-15AT]
MEEITVSAKTLDDAITEALIQLGVTSDQLEYDVIEKGNAGFLGIGRKQAVIKARRKVEKKVNDEPVIDFSDAVKEVMKDSKSDNYHKHNNRDNKKKKDNRKKENYHKNNKNVTASEKTEKVKEETVKTEKKEKNDKPHKPVQERKEIELAKVEDITVKTCEEFLTNVLKAMDMEVEIKTSIDEEGALCIEMNGDNMGILIGKRGQTLDSLQYLTNRVANKAQDGYVRVKLDTEDYRRRRKETLENLAKNIAHKVKRTRRSVSLEPMNPYERRIIHSALQGDRSVTTHSEGEEPYRRVVVTLVRK